MRFRILVLALTLTATAPLAAQDKIRQSVVKVHTTVRLPDLARPWAKRQPQKAFGSGFIIDGKRIVTNAHVVAYASEVYVQGYQDADKIEAKVVALAPGVDLALLELEEDEAKFFDGRPALPIADALPRVRESIDAYGYPTGGEELSVTNGIISRIEMAVYGAGLRGLRIQVDAALNPGNSGGPAVGNGGQVTGVVFSGIPTAENIGYLIPAEELRTFLDDVKDGEYDGKMNMFENVQTVENKALRKKLKLTDEITGLMVTQLRTDVDPDTYPLQEWDVITHIGEHPIDNEGHVRIREDLRVYFYYWVPKLAKDGKIALTVFRDGKSMKISLPVQAQLDYVLGTLNTEYPRFFIYGPMVFSEASREHIGAAGRLQAFLSRARNPLMLRMNDTKAFAEEELVGVFSPLFPHKIAKGYDSPLFGVVEKINGVKVKNLAHTVEVFRDIKDEFVVIEFAGRGYEKVVFKHKDMLAATEEILTDNGIRYQFSKDLRDVWEKE